MEILSRDELYQYWRNPPARNKPETYLIDKNPKWEKQLVQKYADTSASILEIGCNVGRNLNRLFQCGYRNLAGVEINAEAIALMQRMYPEMAKSIKIWVAPIEQIISDFRDGSFDLVFTRATLEHIHPDSEFIFAEIMRIVKRFLILTEGEDSFQVYKYFGRSYQPIFEELGMVQIYEEHLTKWGPNANRRNTKDMWTRVFVKKN